MHRPSAQEFLHTLLQTLDELPPDVARRLEEIVRNEDAQRSEAIRRLFEDLADD